MQRSKLLYWGAQIFGWSAYVLLLTLATYNDSPDRIDANFFVRISSLFFVAIVVTHLMRNSFIRLAWLDKRLYALIPRVLIASFLVAVIISSLTLSVGYFLDDTEENIGIIEILLSILSVGILILFWNAIYFTFHFFQKSRRQEVENLSLESSKNEIELKNLRSQLNPHFLFNALNSIRALVDTEPAKAKDSVTRLSNLLRKSLEMGKESFVELEEELEMVSNYLELEKIRFEERLQIGWNIDPALNTFKVPPFSLQMLVENAVKHGVSKLLDGGKVIISTRQVGNKLEITVSNTGEMRSKKGTGIGIENTKRRLNIQYGGKAKVRVFEKNNEVIAQLIFER